MYETDPVPRSNDAFVRTRKKIASECCLVSAMYCPLHCLTHKKNAFRPLMLVWEGRGGEIEKKSNKAVRWNCEKQRKWPNNI